MNAPSIRFKGFTDAWEQRKLGEIADIITGTTPSTKDRSNYDGKYLFVSPVDIQGNRYVDKTITTLTGKGFSVGRKLRAGTSLFVSIGSTIGKVAQLRQEAVTNQQINAVIPLESMNDDFVYTLLENTSDGIKLLSATQAVPIINKTTFSEVEISFPSKLEQEQIGDYFANLDNLITLHQRKCDNLKQVKKYMLQKMFPKQGEKVPEIRLAGFTGDWEQRKVENIITDMADGPFGSNLKLEHYTEEKEARIIQLSNLSDYGWQDDNTRYTTFEHAQEIKRCIVHENELVMGKMMPAGMTIMRPNTEKMYVLSSDCVRIKLNNDLVIAQFFLYTTKSDVFLNQINSDSQGSTRVRTSISKIRKMDIMLPSVTEQLKIGKYFSNLDNLITLHQRKSDSLKEIKKFMLQNMFPRE